MIFCTGLCTKNSLINNKSHTNTHTQLAVIFAGCLFIKDAHSFHDALVPSNATLQLIKTHCQLCRCRTPVDSITPNGQSFGYFIGIRGLLRRCRSTGGFLCYSGQMRITSTAKRTRLILTGISI